MAPANVFLTVDTEHSIGGAFADKRLHPVGNEKSIFGKIGEREFGIPLIMDIAERYGLKIVFFVEVFNHYFFGPDESRRIVDYILKRGHDVQLHLHPSFQNFTLEHPQEMHFSDLIGQYSFETQTEMLKEAKNRLVSYGADVPTSFRAGCFGANIDTLKALAANGFLIDSSYNKAYLGNPCLLPDLRLNDCAEKSGVFEFPVTNFIEKSGLRSRRYKPLDINGVSFEEIRYVLSASRRGEGPRNVTVILHSFSFVKPYDVQYSKMRSRKYVIRRFDKLCRFLADNTDDFKVKTFGELSREKINAMLHDRCDVMPEIPAWLCLLRFGGQFMDKYI